MGLTCNKDNKTGIDITIEIGCTKVGHHRKVELMLRRAPKIICCQFKCPKHQRRKLFAASSFATKMICYQLFFLKILLLPKIKPVFQKLLLFFLIFFICRQKLDLLQVPSYLGQITDIPSAAATAAAQLTAFEHTGYLTLLSHIFSRQDTYSQSSVNPYSFLSRQYQDKEDRR